MDKKPDAIMCPLQSFAGAGDDVETQSYKLFQAAREIMGVDQPQMFNQGAVRFVAASPYETILYPKMHPKAGQPRYIWTPMEGNPAVKLGHLKDEATDAAAAN